MQKMAKRVYILPCRAGVSIYHDHHKPYAQATCLKSSRSGIRGAKRLRRGFSQTQNPPSQISGYDVPSEVSTFTPSGRKKALLIGIAYEGSREPLRGCIRDVEYMTHLLRTKFSFQDEDFLVMTDKTHKIQNVRSEYPTRKAVLDAMRWLVADAQPGDSLFFHFSGHGIQVRDQSGDEADGYDETILPVDFKANGHILDDEIHEIMVQRLPRGARLTAVMDCCHSGTGMDLPFIHDAHGYGSGMTTTPPRRCQYRVCALVSAGLALLGLRRKRLLRPPIVDPNAGEVILFSGCRDDEKSADTTLLAGVQTGAMTYSFLEAIERGSSSDWHDYTYRSLLNAMREKLKAKGLKQTPQFSTSHPFNLSSQFII